MHRPKPPAACADLDLVLVERALSKHLGDIPRAAKELNIPIPDLRRLTWAKPNLLEEAEIECMGIVARAMSELFRALDSDEPRRRMWAAEKILSSYLARDHPFAPARRGGARAQSSEAASMGSIVFKWAGAPAVTPPAVAELSEALPSPSPPELPRWAGPDPPPPVSGQYAPWEPSALQPRAGGESR